MELVETLDRLDKLTKVAKRKYSRDVARERRKNGEDSATVNSESDEEWKARMDREYALNRWRPS